jgi:hypothetical protein
MAPGLSSGSRATSTSSTARLGPPYGASLVYPVRRARKAHPVFLAFVVSPESSASRARPDYRVQRVTQVQEVRWVQTVRRETQALEVRLVPRAKTAKTAKGFRLAVTEVRFSPSVLRKTSTPTGPTCRRVAGVPSWLEARVKGAPKDQKVPPVPTVPLVPLVLLAQPKLQFR